MTKRVLIAGGGIAGLAAALRLGEHGIAPIVVETRQRLGGRATSFSDPTTGQLLDNCQHVLLRCCTNLIDLYRRLGVLDRVTWHRRITFASPEGHFDAMQADPLPAPLHLTRSLWRMKMLTLADKLAIIRAMLAIMRTSRVSRDALDREPFGDWLRRHGQTEQAIRRYWELVIVSACNEQLDNVSTRYALQVFQEGFLCRTDVYEMGLSEVPLVELYDPAEKAIRSVGGELMLSTSAQQWRVEGGQVTGLQLREQVIEADAYMSAVPFDRALKLAPPELREADARLQRLEEIQVSPIIGVHLELESDKPVMDRPHVVLVDSPIQWVFRKGETSNGARIRQHLHGVISAAGELVEQPAEQLAALLHRELGRVFPSAKSAELVHHRVVKEKRATFALTTGLDAVRPAPGAGAGVNLLLAGDWTATGWPATMEGACRSGYLAAEAALDQLSVLHEPLLAPDPQPDALYRLLAKG